MEIYDKMKIDVDDVYPPPSSTAPPKSSAAGGQGFKAVTLGLSTGGSLSSFKVLRRLSTGFECGYTTRQTLIPIKVKN